MSDSEAQNEVVECFHVLIEGLQKWVENQQLVEKAFASYQDWLNKRAYSIVGAAKDDIQAEFSDPEFSDRVVMPCTHGKTREEAIRHGEEVIEMYLEA